MQHTRESREEIAKRLHGNNQSARTTRMYLEKVRDSVTAYGNHVINKRLCNKIEEDAPRYWQKIEKWNSETHTEETKDESFPVYRCSLEKMDYEKKEWKVNIFFHDSNLHDREMIWFETLPDLVQKLNEKMSYLEACIAQWERETATLDTILSEYDAIATHLAEFEKRLAGSYVLRDCLPLLK